MKVQLPKLVVEFKCDCGFESVSLSEAWRHIQISMVNEDRWRHNVKTEVKESEVEEG